MESIVWAALAAFAAVFATFLSFFKAHRAIIPPTDLMVVYEDCETAVLSLYPGRLKNIPYQLVSISLVSKSPCAFLTLPENVADARRSNSPNKIFLNVQVSSEYLKPDTPCNAVQFRVRVSSTPVSLRIRYLVGYFPFKPIQEIPLPPQNVTYL